MMQNHFNGGAVADPDKDPEPDWIVKKQRFTDIYKNLNGEVKNVEKCDKKDINHKSNDEDKMENVNDVENHDELIMKSNNNNTKVLNNNNNNNEAINLSVSPKSASTCMSDDDNEELNGNISDDSSDNNKKSHKNENSPSTALMYKLNHTKKHANNKRVKEIELDDDCDMKNDIINTNNNYNSKSHKIPYISQKDNANNINNDHIGNKGSSSVCDENSVTTRHVNSSEDSVIDNHEQYNQHNNIINNNHHSSCKKGKF